jgi:hypothetical protein
VEPQLLLLLGVIGVPSAVSASWSFYRISPMHIQKLLCVQHVRKYAEDPLNPIAFIGAISKELSRFLLFNKSSLLLLFHYQ